MEPNDISPEPFTPSVSSLCSLASPPSVPSGVRSAVIVLLPSPFVSYTGSQPLSTSLETEIAFLISSTGYVGGFVFTTAP